MLKTLTVSNFALIDQVQLAFSPGLNILSGETGAGKSILIDAVGVVLGERAFTDFIRHDTDFLRVEAVFDIAEQPELQKLLAEHDIVVDEETLIVSRRFNRNSKNIVIANGCQITLATLRKIGEFLIDIHGQHESQALLRPRTHLTLLDHFAPKIALLLAEYTELYQQWRQLTTQITTHTTQSQERERRIDMLTWQISEIEQAALQPAEDEQAEQEVRLLANVEKVVHAVSQAYDLLKREQQGRAILDGLNAVKRELAAAVKYDVGLQPQEQAIVECLYQIEDAATELRYYLEAIDNDPVRLQKLEDRLDLIRSLKRKYGSSIEEILTYQQQSAQELALLQNSVQTLDQLLLQEQRCKSKLLELSQQLSSERRAAAVELEAAITQQLHELGMPNAVLKVVVTDSNEFLATGCNEVQCLFSANRGDPPKPLQKIASGGELSRLALAIKAVVSGNNMAGTIIFDEVDAGIGGKTVQMVAEKIAFVASRRQVLCITHSPSIAAMADQHFMVEKQTVQEQTFSNVSQLNSNEQIIEVARMLAGDSTKQLVLDNAKQILDDAKKIKTKWAKQPKP